MEINPKDFEARLLKNVEKGLDKHFEQKREVKE